MISYRTLGNLMDRELCGPDQMWYWLVKAWGEGWISAPSISRPTMSLREAVAVFASTHPGSPLTNPVERMTLATYLNTVGRADWPDVVAIHGRAISGHSYQEMGHGYPRFNHVRLISVDKIATMIEAVEAAA